MAATPPLAKSGRRAPQRPGRCRGARAWAVACAARPVAARAVELRELQDMCWADYGTDVASACCSRSHSQDGGATACPVALLDSAFPLELCCLGPSAAEAPLRGCEAPLQEALVAADGTVDVPAVLQAEPVRLFDDFIYVVIRFFFGGLLNSRFVRIWQAIEKSGEAARELCPVAHALSQLLRAEFELAASLPVLGGGPGAWALSSARRDGLLAAARGSALGGAASSALLHAAHRRVALWEAALGARAPPAGGGGAAEASCPPAVAALPPFACRALQAWAAVGAAEPWGDGPRRAAGTASVVDLWRGGFACARWERRTGQASREEPRPGRGFVPAPLVDGGSEDLLRREVRWLERASLRRSPNPLCWTPERRQRGLTPELCCGQPGRLTVDAQACWDAVYSAGPCCSRPAGHRCGDLVLAAASDGVRTWETDDVLREFHGALAGELLWASRGVGREAAPGDDGPPLEALAALASLWPEADLKERCPEAWALARLLDLVAPGAPGAAELAGDPRSRELLEVYAEDGGEWLSDALRAAAGSRAALPAGDLDTGSAEWTGHPTSKVEHAWRSALEQCASAVCSWNAVEEDAAAGAACSGIPVRSEHGGVGRTTAFGRALWCAAQLTPARLAIDLYGGEGDTAVLLADGLRAQAGGDGLLATFEADVGRARRVSARLAARGVAVREVLLPPGGVVGAEVERAFQEAAQQGGVGAVVFAGRTSTTVLNEGRSVLAAACGRAGGLGLVLLDPDVEMGPHEFAEDWRALERCGPLATAIYNTNLPGGAGWVRERLVHAGGHREVLAGFNDGGSGEADVLYQLRAWSLLVLGSARLPGVAGGDGGRAALPPQAGGASAEQDLEQMRVLSSMESGASWIGATFRSTRGGAVKKVHSAVEGIVPVQMLRPTDELLAPPAVDTNPHACFSELNSDAADYRFRVPCFLTCEGPDFDSSWGDFRRLVHQNAKDGYPPDEVLFGTASRLIADVAFNDSALILGRSRFMSRLRHEFTTDGHLEAFCLYGIASALFVRARTFLRSAAVHEPWPGPLGPRRGHERPGARMPSRRSTRWQDSSSASWRTLGGRSAWRTLLSISRLRRRRSLGSPFVASLGAAAAGAGPGWGAPPVLGRRATRPCWTSSCRPGRSASAAWATTWLPRLMSCSWPRRACAWRATGLCSSSAPCWGAIALCTRVSSTSAASAASCSALAAAPAARPTTPWSSGSPE
ncbi:unnamed protein product [Prorocentrum cordatum]|uniref:Uncharacterized protein n=1 Tax=Prorocentrum cordatum TaxID=2364126 RepID=A0ABN9WI50_9DINO|nr:unnamed protein product [Polarella glacialis]